MRDKTPAHKHILSVFVLLALMLVFLIAYNYNTLNRHQESLDVLEATALRQLLLIQKIENNALARKLNLFNYFLSDDTLMRTRYFNHVKNLHRENNNVYADLEESLVRDFVKEKFLQVTMARAEYNRLVNYAIDRELTDNGFDELEYDDAILRPAFEAYFKELNELSSLFVKFAEDNISEIRTAANSTRIAGNFFLAIAIVLLIVSGIALSRIIKKLRHENQLLKSSQEELNLLYHSLEDKVQERTQELKNANRKLYDLYAIVNLSENPIIVRDLHDRVTFFNVGAERFYGLDAKEVKGKNLLNMVTRDFKKPYTEIKNELFEKGEWSGEITVHRDLEKSIVSSNMTVYKGPDGIPQSILEINLDITERKLMEDEIRAYNNSLKEINSSKDKLFSVISHDLRSPVASLLSSSEILKERIETLSKEEISEFSSIIHRTTSRLLNQLNDLTDWAKTQHHKNLFNPRELRLCLEVSRALKLVKANAEQKSIRLENKIPLDYVVYADHFMLRSIIQNLVSNSIKFTPEGGHILLTAHRNEGWIDIHVMDNGRGMGVEKVKELLKPGASSSETGTQMEKGTGLGFLLVKDFIAHHNGSFNIESKEGKGTTVVFTLPINALALS
jgi:PAS domain S-box-containing protein